MTVLLGTLWNSIKQIEAPYVLDWENAIALDTMQGLKNFSLSIKVITVKLKLIQLLAQFSSVCGEDCIHVHTWEKKKNKQFKTFLPHLPNTDLYSLYLRTRKFSFLFLTFVVFHM